MDLSKLIKKKKISSYIIYTLIILGGIALDQLTKFLAVKYLMPVGSVPIIDGVIHLTYLENPGAAFGMLKDAPWLFNTITLIVLPVLTAYLYLGHIDEVWSEISVAMIITGGIGNTIDRLSMGYVVDFIDFTLIDFAIFNVADSFVTVGAGILIVSLIIQLVKEILKDMRKNEARDIDESDDGGEE